MTNPFVEAATAYLNQTIPLNEDRKTAQSAREYSDNTFTLNQEVRT